jgi:hypothetical protein
LNCIWTSWRQVFSNESASEDMSWSYWDKKFCTLSERGSVHCTTLYANSELKRGIWTLGPTT